MEIQKFIKNTPMLAAIGLMAFIPATSMAAVERSCAPAQQEPQYTTARGEARGLLNEMWRDADQITHRTNSLQAMADHPTADRRMQTEELEHIRAEVADMHKGLCRLEAIEGSLPSTEQQAIDEAAPLVRSMASDSQDATGDLNASIAYGGYMSMLHTEAQAVAQDINTGEHVVGFYQRSAEQQKNSGILPASGT